MLINVNAHEIKVDQKKMRCESGNCMKLDLRYNSIYSVKPSVFNIRDNKLLNNDILY